MNYRQTLRIVAAMTTLGVMALLPVIGAAQGNQLMLADILIALRSKKVPLNERNDIISKAVTSRGITFTLTPEIEKELKDTGAALQLIAAIRHKIDIVKPAVAVPKAETKSAPAPPDFAFYQKRGDAALAGSDLDNAVAEYSRSIEMNPAWIGSYLGRGAAMAQKQMLVEAIKDYDKVIELKPDNGVAHFRRAELLEKKGDIELALAAYKKAFELDPSNETSKLAAARITADKEKAAKLAEAAAVASKPSPGVKAPEFLQIGALSKDQAVSLVMPSYPPSVSRASISGQVTVEVILDKDGKVIFAKAISGSVFLRQSAEAAALRSKFKPVAFNGEPIKAKGSITYNFTNGR